MKKIVLLIIGLGIFIGIDYFLSKTQFPVNQSHYLLGFDKFMSTARNTKGKQRIILVGGSSLAWGVSAERLSSSLEILTLNSGIHGGIGFMHFLELIKDVIDKKKDILVFSPEYSLISNDSVFSRSKEYCFISLYVNKTYPLKCMGYSINLISRVFPILDIEQSDYRNDGFNKYGDFIFRRAGVNMVGKFNSYDEICSQINILDLKNSYIPYVRGLEKKGYNIIYIPNFIPRSTCKNEKKVNQFHKLLFNEFGINGFEKATLLFNENYFYNSPNHLTINGVLTKTLIFEKQLQSYFNNL